MKYIKLVFIVMLMGLVLMGCSEKPDPIIIPEDPIIIPEDPIITPEDPIVDPEDPFSIEDGVKQDTLSVNSYASGLEFTVFTYKPTYPLPETYIDVEIRNISYSPILNKVCFSYDIHDKQYQRATYYILLQDTDRRLTRQQIEIYGGQEDFSGRVCVDVTDKSLDYRIVIGKDDRDNLNPTYGYIKGSAWIEFADLNKNNRKEISINSYTDTTPDETSNLKYSQVAYSLEIKDQDDAITNLAVVIKNTFGNIVETKQFTSSEISNNHILKLSNDIFDGLAPNVEYEIDVYAFGNDGVDDFNSLYLFSIDAISSRIAGQTTSDQVSAFHGLYAVIYEREETEDSVIISYVYSNENAISYSEDSEKLYLHMILYDENGIAVGTFPMVVGEQSITLPLEYIGENSRLEIRDQRDQNLFDIHYFEVKDPRATIYTTTDHFEIKFDGDSSHVTNIDINIYVVGYAVRIETIENFDFRNSKTIDIYHDVSNVEEILFEIVITYIAYGKEYTITEYKTRG